MWEGSAPQPCFHVPATELGPGEGSRGTGGSSLTICEHSGGTEGLLGSGLAAAGCNPHKGFRDCEGDQLDNAWLGLDNAQGEPSLLHGRGPTPCPHPVTPARVPQSWPTVQVKAHTVSTHVPCTHSQGCSEMHRVPVSPRVPHMGLEGVWGRSHPIPVMGWKQKACPRF